MKLSELFNLCDPDEDVYVTTDVETPYEGKAKDCPAHMLDNEVTKTRVFCEQLAIYTKAPEVEAMTWQQLADEIRKMPEWARRMPAMVYIDPCKDYTPDMSHCISGMGTYYSSKNPGDIKDDGMDFAFIDLDAPVNY
jgi:hypothetical protein